MDLISEFKEIRKVSTPWCVVRTTDYRSVINQFKELADDVLVWTCVDGPYVVKGDKSTTIGTSDDAPFTILKNSIDNLPTGAILFFVIPDNTILENSFVIQAISNVRDYFKSNKRTLVILGTNPVMPPFLSEDVPVLDDPLPLETELKALSVNLVSSLKEKYPDLAVPDSDLEKGSAACLGMTRFAAEEAISRKLRKSSIDLAGLSLVRKSVIETASNRALMFEKEPWTFDNIGGLSAFKQFMTDLYQGPKPFKLVVRVDEIDKSVTAASSGTVADNTGVSQDILKTLLTSIEDNKWLGLLAVGGPGTGKTLASICTGNQFQVQTLALDLGAVKGSLVGESEQKIRRVLDILKTVGGENVLIMATANRLDTIPPELIRRFWLGTWFWDLPTDEERKAIWTIQRKRFQIPDSDATPVDTGWTGSDIRNCCQMAWITRTTLMKAADRISLVGKSARQQIETLRTLAEQSDWRSANLPGAYRRPKKVEEIRSVSLN